MSHEQNREIKITGPADRGTPVEVHRGIGHRVLSKVGLDSRSLEEAGVIRTHQAQAAESLAQGNPPVFGSEKVGLNGHVRTQNLRQVHQIHQIGKNPYS